MSGQIGSDLEWYHWIGLEKDINRKRLIQSGRTVPVPVPLLSFV
jgi:hypothetical protein